VRNFLKIGSVQVGGMQQVLWRNPQLWNQHPFRRTYQGTPHEDTDDIWIRYLPEGQEGQMRDIGSTESVWHKESEVLNDCVRSTVLDLMRATNSFTLDRLLISRLPPGGRILRHHDRGMAYTSIPGLARYHIVIQGLPGSMFYCGDEEVNMKTGEIWWFNPLEEHSVCNNSAGDRIHLMADLRAWP
jgi:hypothetical protein